MIIYTSMQIRRENYDWVSPHLKRTNASPVARPSGFLTKRTPCSSSSTLQGSSPLLKNSIWRTQGRWDEIISIFSPEDPSLFTIFTTHTYVLWSLFFPFPHTVYSALVLLFPVFFYLSDNWDRVDEGTICLQVKIFNSDHLRMIRSWLDPPPLILTHSFYL